MAAAHSAAQFNKYGEVVITDILGTKIYEKNYALALSMLLLASAILAQSSVKIYGKITDSDNKPISFAEIAINNDSADSIPAAQVNTNAAGMFHIAAPNNSVAVLTIKNFVFETKIIALK